MGLVVETDRLVLWHLVESDAEFILRLLNEPSFVEYIGDKGVRSLADARAYISDGPGASYAEHGFGLYLVRQKADGVAIGICGLLKRDTLEDVDIGFALLPEFCSLGFATEAAEAVLMQARDIHRLDRVVAITTPRNDASKHVLEKLGLTFEQMIRLSPEEDEICLYGRTLAALTPSG